LEQLGRIGLPYRAVTPATLAVTVGSNPTCSTILLHETPQKRGFRYKE
jgi:hypothetical protein